MKTKQPLFGNFSPGSQDRKLAGPVDKNSQQLERNVSKMMKGTASPGGAGENATQDAQVNKQDKALAPNVQPLLTKGLRAEQKPLSKAERVNTGTNVLEGKVDLGALEAQESAVPTTYKDYQKPATSSSVVITRKKLQVK